MLLVRSRRFSKIKPDHLQLGSKSCFYGPDHQDGSLPSGLLPNPCKNETDSWRIVRWLYCSGCIYLLQALCYDPNPRGTDQGVFLNKWAIREVRPGIR